MKKLGIMLAVLLACLMLSIGVSMATTSQVIVVNGTYTDIVNVTFGADTDTTHTYTHGLGAVPDDVQVTPWDINCAVATNATGTPDYSAIPFVCSVSSTTVVVGKASKVGSATCMARVRLQVLHSIIK